MLNFVHQHTLCVFQKLFQTSTRGLRQIAKTSEQFRSEKSRQILQPDDPKLLRVAIIGCPNAGKSTLMNEIIHWRVSAVSSKVHTTQKNVIGVYSHHNTQIEFVDTPGMVSRTHIARHNLQKSFKTDPERSLSGVDIIAFVSDVSNKRERHHINAGVLELLSRNRDKESILVLNKIDKLRNKRCLIDFTSALTSGIVDGKPLTRPDSKQLDLLVQRGNFEHIFNRTEQELAAKSSSDSDKSTEAVSFQEDGIGWPNFNRVFMVSALQNDGVASLRSYLMSRAQSRPWLHNPESVTTLPPKELILDALREVCLDVLYQEIPYKIRFEIVMWELDELDNLVIVAEMHCAEKFVSLIIGPKGTNISTIVRKSREALCNIFHCDVSLKLAVKPIFSGSRNSLQNTKKNNKQQ